MSILSSTKTGSSAFLIPESKGELIDMIKNEIKEKGLNCDLNHIKTHKITDMSLLFSSVIFYNFNGDISNWNVSNVRNMCGMFYNSYFNGDISKWNVSNVKDMSYMFKDSEFNGDISKWNVLKVEDMSFMFYNSEFNKDISNWQLNIGCNTFLSFEYCKINDKYKPKLEIKK